jgi:hypothetical protein
MVPGAGGCICKSGVMNSSSSASREEVVPFNLKIRNLSFQDYIPEFVCIHNFQVVRLVNDAPRYTGPIFPLTSL